MVWFLFLFYDILVVYLFNPLVEVDLVTIYFEVRHYAEIIYFGA